MKKFFFFTIASLLSVISVQARVYVQTSNESDPRWNIELIGEDDQLITFTKVADLPTTACKEIWFAAGTYTFDAMYNIEQADAILVGGFAGTETSIEERAMAEGKDVQLWEFKNVTIIDGNKAVKIIADTKRTSFDGLTIINANQSGNAGICRLNDGKNSDGEYCISTVRRCVLKDNVATGQGGCFQLYNASAIIEDCYFSGNTGSQGGAVYGNISSGTLTIRNCYFVNNNATGSSNAGGAVHVQNAAELILTGCVFEGNTASNKGQGAALSNASTNVESVIANNIFHNNTAAVDGNKCVVLMENGNFYYNTLVENEGMTIWQKAGTVKNNVFYATDAEKARTSLTEGVVYTHNAGVNAWAETADASNIVLSLNNTKQEGDEEGTLYAAFADPEAHDFALTAGSALIAAGEAIETINTDFAGATRTNADLGAYAFNGEIPTAVENIAQQPIDIQAALEAGEVYTIMGQRVNEVKAGNLYIVSGRTVVIR